MPTTTLRKKTVLKLDTLKVETLVMPAAAPIKAVTTSNTCPTRCDTDFDCGPTADINCTRYC
jgi:hypothetical protein